MKILLMLDPFGDTFNKPIIDRVKASFPGAEVVLGDWVGDGDVTELTRQVEVTGPEPFPVPQAFVDNKDAEILIGSFCPFSSKGFDTFDNLKLLGVIRAGMENVNVEAAKERGIAVVNAAGRNADSVSDFAVALMLATLRDVAISHERVRQGRFKDDPFPNDDTMFDLRGRTLGIVGFGYIGKLVAKKMSGFEMRTEVYDPFVPDETVRGLGCVPVDKQTLFRDSDIVTIHARYTKDTYHIVDKEQIDAMKPSSYLINTARAGLLNYDALIDALREGRISGAGLDVYEEEPLPQDSPLLTLPNVTLTAHIAGRTVTAAENSPRFICERAEATLRGERPAGLLNPDIQDDPSFRAWADAAQGELFA